MTNSPTLYYVTTPENADAILRHGFRGEVILKDQIHNGDWSKDRAIVEVSFACDISQFVKPNSAIGYRTWRIPATFINSYAKSRTIHGRLLVSPKFKHYVERLSDLTPDRIAKIAEIVDPAIIEKMMDCLQRMRPRHRSRSDNEKERVRRSPMDRGRAKMHPIVRSEVERRLRSKSAGSIRAALIRIPILINAELRVLKDTKLPHVRVLQRRLVALLRQYGLGPTLTPSKSNPFDIK